MALRIDLRTEADQPCAVCTADTPDDLRRVMVGDVAAITVCHGHFHVMIGIAVNLGMQDAADTVCPDCIEAMEPAI